MRTDPTCKLDRHTVSRTLTLLLTVTLGSSLGCRLCCDGEDVAYPAYGGVWERTLRNEGRVGSLYAPAGARTAELTDRNAPAENDATRSNIIPPERLDEDPDDDAPAVPVPEDAVPEDAVPEDAAPEDDLPPRSEGETEEEFQERLKRFQQEQLEQQDNEPLNAMVIPGTPQPPSVR
jgi:hypothetical protein